METYDTKGRGRIALRRIPVGLLWWVDEHGSAADNGGAADCQACHGPDYRGTVLSQAHADRTFDADDFGTKTFARGYEIGCYDCHNGPSGEDDDDDDS